PEYGRAEPHGFGPFKKPDLDLEASGCWISLRCGLPHPPGCLNFRIVGQCDRDQFVGGDLAHEAGGHVEHSVGRVVVRDSDDYLAGPYHLAGLGALGDHDTWSISPKLAVAEMVLGLMQL